MQPTAAGHGPTLLSGLSKRLELKLVWAPRLSISATTSNQPRAEQQGPAWRDDYRATRPKVERKQGHLVGRKHWGGRRARVRSTKKVDADINLFDAAHNLARLAVPGVRSGPVGSWRIA